jgi:hypothetical protein
LLDTDGISPFLGRALLLSLMSPGPLGIFGFGLCSIAAGAIALVFNENISDSDIWQ